MSEPTAPGFQTLIQALTILSVVIGSGMALVIGKEVFGIVSSLWKKNNSARPLNGDILRELSENSVRQTEILSGMKDSHDKELEILARIDQNVAIGLDRNKRKH
jgi:hypothetical protein